MITLEMQDIQGLIVRGYKNLPAASFLVLKINDAPKAKAYLDKILPQITRANNSRPQMALHIAFTWKGLKKLGTPDTKISFSREFREGMTEPLRSALLGDQDENDPQNWRWGGPNTDAVHMLLLCYGKNEEVLDRMVRRQRRRLLKSDISIIKELKTIVDNSSNLKEHFGFHDGISQPPMEGLSGSARKDVPNPIKAGEFVLGYHNEYKQFTASPYINECDDPEDILPYSRETSFKDLGKNGTYLVLRQMTQDVFNFWDYLKKNSKEPAPDPDQAAINLGAKMVGRWPGGAPLSISAFDDPKKKDANSFSYLNDDPDGLKCPFGAHIRRTNPRDQLFSGRNASDASEMARKHKIVRRGRIFGKPIVASMDPKDILKVEKDDGVERGLHFICLAGHISRQFEFIQNVWVNNPVFADLYNDGDPIISSGDKTNDDFTCQARPLRRKYENVPQFTNVVGGAYFFLPGIDALKFIAYAKPQPAIAKIASPAINNPGTGNKVIANEYPEPREDHHTDALISVLRKSLQREYGRRKFFRRFHPKSLGLVAAKIQVEKGLPGNLKVGLFKNEKTYDAWVRFSNAAQHVSPDYKKGVRGMSIKVLEVDRKPLEKDECGKTQDFILTNNKVLFPGTAKLQLLANRAIFLNPLYYFIIFFTFKFKGLYSFLKGVRFNPGNILECSFFSSTPYLFGEGQAVKWHVRPSLKTGPFAKPDKADKDFLRQRLTDDLSGKSVDFDLCIQLQEDADTQPIENSATEWKTSFIKVATITVLQQDFNTPERKKLEESILFSPWHSMPAHRPLGGINRMRRRIYNELSGDRALHNKKSGC